jgi:hypothetical protein
MPEFLNRVPEIVNRVYDVLAASIVRSDLAPKAGEVPAGSQAPIHSQEKLAQIFFTIVNGNANNVALGATQPVQSVNIGQGDLEALRERLFAIGIPNQNVEELSQGLVAVSSPAAKKNAAEGWLGKLGISAANGAISASFGLAAKALGQYLGMHGL